LTHIKDFQKKGDGIIGDIRSAWDNTEVFKKEERELADQLDNIQVDIKQVTFSNFLKFSKFLTFLQAGPRTRRR
jgi:tetrahydromethanopterin S-methyltransferase subunit H